MEDKQFTARDVVWLAEVGDSFRRLPWLYQQYYLLKLRFVIMRRRLAFLGVAMPILTLGLLVFLRQQDPMVSAILVLFGFCLGVVASWQAESMRQ